MVAVNSFRLVFGDQDLPFTDQVNYFSAFRSTSREENCANQALREIKFLQILDS